VWYARREEPIPTSVQQNADHIQAVCRTHMTFWKYAGEPCDQVVPDAVVPWHPAPRDIRWVAASRGKMRS
jgi:hypothetical protein